MSDETLRILKLLETGRITAAEAEELLKAVKEAPSGSGDEQTSTYGTEPGRIIATVLKEVNPGRIVHDTMEAVMENIQTRMPKMPRVPKMPGMSEMPHCCFGTHRAEEEQVIKVPAEGISRLALSQPRSQITVKGTDSEQIVIKAQVQAWGDDEDEARERLKSLKVAVERDNETLRLKVDGPPWTKKRRAQIDFHLELPKNIALELGTASGDIVISDMCHSLKAQTASGEIRLARCRGRAEISTASGDMEIKDLYSETEVEARTASGDIEIKSPGRFVLHTISGDIRAVVASGSLLASSVSGDMEVELDEFQSLALNTTSGDIEVRLSSTPPSQAKLESVSGDIDLELPDNPSAEIEALTASGDIDCDLDLADANRTSRRLSGRLADGRARILLRTTSGDIDVA